MQAADVVVGAVTAALVLSSKCRMWSFGVQRPNLSGVLCSAECRILFAGENASYAQCSIEGDNVDLHRGVLMPWRRSMGTWQRVVEAVW